GQVPTRGWPDRERGEGVYRRVAQLTQLLILKAIEDAKVPVRCPRSDQGPGAIRCTETLRVGFSVPGRTLVVPAEQRADAAPQLEEPSDHRRRRLAPRDHHGPQVTDRTASAATRERNRHASSSGTSCSSACTRRGHARKSPGSIRIVKQCLYCGLLVMERY